MFAGRFSARRQVEVFELPDAALTAGATGEILFQPELVCLCGSDLPFFDDDFEGHGITYPSENGKSLHEMIGTVVSTNGTRFSAGDRVLAVPEEQLGFFERFTLSEQRAIPLDSTIPEDEALLAQPFGTVLFALQKLPDMTDKTAVVVGQGPIGQMFNAGLKSLGAKNIVGVDLLAERLAVSQSMGATATICNSQCDASEALQNILGNVQPTVVIEAVGHRAQAFDLCVQLCGHESKLLYFGVPAETIRINMKAAMDKNLTILTSLHPDFEHTFPLAMKWIGQRRVDLTPLITHRFDLDNIQTAFDTFRDRTGGAHKVLVEFPALKKAEK